MSGCASLLRDQQISSDFLNFTPIRLPHPLPIYEKQANFLAQNLNGQGEILTASTNHRLTRFEVIDDVIVPPEFERYILLSWGDRVFANSDDYVGYNHDYTGFVPTSPDNQEGYLWINHEYISFPFTYLVGGTPDNIRGKKCRTSFKSAVGFPLPSEQGEKANRATIGEMFYNVGASIVKIRREDGRYRVVNADPGNRRIHGLSGLAINAERSDHYQRVTAWGNQPHQESDNNYLEATGPAATDVFETHSTDGLGRRIIGTAFNCSGATTPWGTILSAEENIQYAYTEPVNQYGIQVGYKHEFAEAFGLVGEKYGWMVEGDVTDSSKRVKKHTALGRFRHENAVLKVRAGEPLVVYMGEDRRGGHVYKFISNDPVARVEDKANSKLFERGILYVARFNPDGSGRWIPLQLDTPTGPLTPTYLSKGESASRGNGQTQQDSVVRLPNRSQLNITSEIDKPVAITQRNENHLLPKYQNRTLADFYDSQGAILCDAYLASNLVGGTPTARPEDLELHPHTGELFIAFTSGAPDEKGYPDSNIFVVGKYDTDVATDQPEGGLYKLIEDEVNPLQFQWQRFKQSGEAGTENGMGFASIDNMQFDVNNNLWVVTDMKTSLHNGYDSGVGSEEELRKEVNHASTDHSAQNLVGVFGNNWMFMIPSQGEYQGYVIPFAQGPNRAELTGPTFIDDTLILSVQHPGENSPIQEGEPLERNIEMLDLNGELFNQARIVAHGSNWPSNIQDKKLDIPKPSTIAIVRKKS